jgi:hypothetical protein
MLHHPLSINVVSTTAPPVSTSVAGSSAAPHQAQAMPNTISSNASNDISGAGS